MKPQNNHLLVKIIEDEEKKIKIIEDSKFIKVEVLEAEDYNKGDKLICRNYPIEAYGYTLIKDQDILIKL